MKLVSDEGIEIAEIKRINLKPDDVLVFDFKESKMPLENLNTISKNLNSMFPNNKILMIYNGIELQVMNNGGSKDEQRN